MIKRLFAFILFSLIVVFGYAQDTLSGKCKFCDTSFYHIKKIGGEVEKAYPLKITCFFSDSLGNKSTKKCTIQQFIKGELSGAESSYYYSEKVYLVNWWGRRYKRPIKPWRKKIFASEMADYSLEYRGYWRKGKKHGLWTYYSRDGKIVLVQEYNDGVLVQQ